MKGIDAGDVDRYLGIIEERVRTKKTGAQWQLTSPKPQRPDESVAALLATQSFSGVTIITHGFQPSNNQTLSSAGDGARTCDSGRTACARASR